MSITRTSTYPILLAEIDNFTIQLVKQNNYTYVIKISQINPPNETIQFLPLDTSDNTVTAVIDPTPFGDAAERIFAKLSEILREEIGGKQIFFIPEPMTLPEYTPPPAATKEGFNRLRHGNMQDISNKCKEQLEEYKKITKELNEKYYFEHDINQLLAVKKITRNDFYKEIYEVLALAGFTRKKQEEYADEQGQSTAARCENQNISFICMVTKETHKIVGFLRIGLTPLPSHPKYLCDEVIIPDILSEKDFSDEITYEEQQEINNADINPKPTPQEYNRKAFLLAYLMNKTYQHGIKIFSFTNQDLQPVSIIAAEGGTLMYRRIGFQSFPMNIPGWKAVMHFSDPGPTLRKIQKEIKTLHFVEKLQLVGRYNRFHAVHYQFDQNKLNIQFYVNQEQRACFLIDPTDNRITTISLDSHLDLRDIKELTQWLGKNFGGKQILTVPEKLKKYFIECGYSSSPIDNSATDRMRETFIQELRNIHPSTNIALDNNIHINNDFNHIDSNQIKNLMENSGFLSPKIDQYLSQGLEGFKLMCQQSMPFGLQDIDGKLIAFCRVTDLKNGDYYLSDTFVDETAFGTKQSGTSYLYKIVGDQLDQIIKQNSTNQEEKSSQHSNARILLIAPPNRLEEFKTYGCCLPNDLLLKFNLPQKGFTLAFEKATAQIEHQTEYKTLRFG